MEAPTPPDVSYTGDSHPRSNGGKLRFPAVFPFKERRIDSGERASPARSAGVLANPPDA